MISLKILTDIAVIGGYDRVDYEQDSMLKDVEVIAILNDSVSYVNKTIPPLPHRMDSLRGAQLSNGNLILCGGRRAFNHEMNNQYLLFQDGSSQWNKIGKMKEPRFDHSSVFMDGRLFTCGGWTSADITTSHHEAFSLDAGVNKKKEMPEALRGHSASKIGQHKMLICGGLDDDVI